MKNKKNVFIWKEIYALLDILLPTTETKQQESKEFQHQPVLSQSWKQNQNKDIFNFWGQ